MREIETKRQTIRSLMAAVLFEAAAGHDVLLRAQGGVASFIEFTLIWDEAKKTGS